MKQYTAKDVKRIFKEGSSFMLDQLNDSLEVKRYIWRLESRNIVYIAAESNYYCHICLVKK